MAFGQHGKTGGYIESSLLSSLLIELRCGARTSSIHEEVILKVIENLRLNLVHCLLLFRRVPRSIYRLFHRTCETTLTRVELATNYAVLGERTADLLAYTNKSAKKLPGQFRKGCRLTDLSDVAIWIELFANGTLGRDRARVGRVGVFLSTCRLRGVEDGVVGRHFALL